MSICESVPTCAAVILKLATVQFQLFYEAAKLSLSVFDSVVVYPKSKECQKMFQYLFSQVSVVHIVAGVRGFDLNNSHFWVFFLFFVVVHFGV